MKGERKWTVNLAVVGFAILLGSLLMAWGLLRAFTVPAETVDLSKREPPKGQNPEDDHRLRFAVATMVSPESTFVSYRKLVELVGRKTGQDTILVIRPSYREVREELENGTVDIAFVCTGTYAMLVDTGKVKMIATPTFSGSARYRCSIIVAADSPARSLADLKGKSFAFTDPESCTGDFIPRCLFAERGIDPASFFGKTIYTGSHDKSVTAVSNHVVAAAGIDHLILHSMYPNPKDLEKKARIIWQSETFGPPPVVMPAGTDPELMKNLQRALLSLHEDPAAQPLLRDIGIARFDEPDLKAYDKVVALFRKKGRTLPPTEDPK